MANGYLASVVTTELPTMAVLVVGLVLALTRLGAGAWARLAAAGLAVLLVNDVVWLAVSATYALGRGPYGGPALFQLWGVAGTVLVVVGTGLLVAAVFTGRRSAGGRPPAPPAHEDAAATPFGSPYGPGPGRTDGPPRP
ncbi:hypothetical protein [Thalassiella azotivora]